MRTTSSRALGLALLTLALATPADAVKTKTLATKKRPGAPELKQWTLANGLHVIYFPDHKAPVATVQLFYHVGSKDEPDGKRGMAHMFEHMMFKGSQHVQPEQHMRFVAMFGGYSNADTEEDRIRVIDNIPPSALDFTLKLEADRMRGLVLTQKTIDSEREVVKEELRRNEQNPVFVAFQRVMAEAYTKHPYHWLAGGEKQLLDTVTLDDCKKFYDKWFRPNNALLIVGGDVDEAAVRAAVDQHFAPLEKGPPPVHDVPVEPPQTELREATLSLPVQLPVVIGGYHVPAGGSDDLYPLAVLGQILSGGESSRLHQRLVRKEHLAVAAGGLLRAHEDPGLFITFALYLPSSDVTQIKEALDEEVARVSSSPVEPRELAKAKNQLAAQTVYERERVEDISAAMGQGWVVEHDPMNPFVAPQKYDAVSAEDVMRVAKKYLTKTNLTLVTLVPAKRGAK
jgi:zinc protease